MQSLLQGSGPSDMMAAATLVMTMCNHCGNHVMIMTMVVVARPIWAQTRSPELSMGFNVSRCSHRAR
eukprot:15477101-Alexandrium_andersonii.AAC.1